MPHCLCVSDISGSSGQDASLVVAVFSWSWASGGRVPHRGFEGVYNSDLSYSFLRLLTWAVTPAIFSRFTSSSPSSLFLIPMAFKKQQFGVSELGFRAGSGLAI